MEIDLRIIMLHSKKLGLEAELKNRHKAYPNSYFKAVQKMLDETKMEIENLKRISEMQPEYWRDLMRVGTVQEVATMWDRSITAVRLWIDTNKIAAYQDEDGRNWTVSLISVMDYAGPPVVLTPKAIALLSNKTGL